VTADSGRRPVSGGIISNYPAMAKDCWGLVFPTSLRVSEMSLNSEMKTTDYTEGTD
jgi:hypothetical protein